MEIESLTIKRVFVTGCEYNGYKGDIYLGDIILLDDKDEEEILEKIYPNVEVEKLYTIIRNKMILDEGLVYNNDKLLIYIKDDISGYDLDWVEDPSIGIALFHKRYDLPNNSGLDSSDFDSFKSMYETIIEEYDPVIIKPVFGYDHGGLSIYLRPIYDWDAGQLGYVWISRKQKEEEGLTDKQCEDRIVSYIQYLSDIIEGNILEVSIIDLMNEPGKKDFLLSSCGGFIGDDINENGIAEYIQEQIQDKNLLEGILDENGKFID